jgi:hypothetical protein
MAKQTKTTMPQKNERIMSIVTELEKIRFRIDTDYNLLLAFENDFSSSLNDIISKTSEISARISNLKQIDDNSTLRVKTTFAGRNTTTGLVKKTDGFLGLDKDFRSTIINALEQQNKMKLGYENLLNGMIFIYSVAIFDALFSDIVKVILSNFSNTLKSSKTLSVQQIFEFNSFDELKESIVDRELIEFTFKSFKDQSKYLTDKFNLILKPVLITDTIEIIETRNIHVHNSGKVNSRYLTNTESSSFIVGQYRVIDENYLQTAFKTLKEVLHFSIDKLILKFSK